MRDRSYGTMWRLALEWSALLVACVGLFPMAWWFGTSPSTYLRYLAYVLAFDVVPGSLLYLALQGNGRRPAIGLSFLGWAIGLALETSIYWACDRTGLRAAFPFYPAIVIPALVIWLGASSRRLPRTACTHHYRSPAFLLTLALPVLLLSGPLFTRQLDWHLIFQSAIATSIQRGFPYEWFELVGMPLHYNYLFHSHLAGASAVTRVPVLELAGRSVPFLSLILCLGTTYFFAIRHYRSRWIGILVVAQIFGVVGWQTIQTWYLGSGIPLSSALVLSTLVSFPIFFTTVSLASDALRERHFPRRPLLLILLLMWSLAGIRAAGLVAFGFGVGFIALVRVVKARRSAVRPALLLACSLLVFSSGLFVFYGAGSPYGTTGFMELVSGPWASFGRPFRSLAWFESLGLPTYAAGIAAFLLCLLGQVTFLLPGLLAAAILRSESRHGLDPFWVGTILCGGVFLFFTAASGHSHFTFMYYGHFGMAFLGAAGLLALLRARRFPAFRAISLALAGCLLLLHAAETIDSLVANREDLRFQSSGPAVVRHRGYDGMLEHLRGLEQDDHVYYVAIEADLAAALYADVPGLRLLATRRGLRVFEPVLDVPELSRRNDFAQEIDLLASAGDWDIEQFQDVKDRTLVAGPIRLILVGSPNEDASRPSSADFSSGELWLFELD